MPILVAGLLAAGCATALHLGIAPEVLLWLAPVLLVIVPLATGRFPGEDVLAACRARRRTRRVARPAAVAAPKAPASRRIGGGRLIALRFAERGPPAVASCCI